MSSPVAVVRSARAWGVGTIQPPATIGILGGGQLGRMLGLAARAMGFRLIVLDPDASCPAAAIADEVVVGAYDDVEAALALADRCEVVTYELEHLAVAIVDRLAIRIPVRPSRRALAVSQDRLAERRFLDALGVPVAPWRAVRSADELRAAAAALVTPLRVKSVTGGYDGRGQERLSNPDDASAVFASLHEAGPTLLAERELDFELELSVVVARSASGEAAPFPVAQNRHDRGILVESVAPARIEPSVAKAATSLAIRIASALEVVGTLTVEMFLLRDGSLVVNELAPRVHNTGHWTIEGAATSQFEQHVRAICELPLGATDQLRPSAMVNLLGTGPRRPARFGGVETALSDPAVHLHVYDKREVFERRKMGHVTALDETVEGALARARAAAGALTWE
ncbi:MAG: 5-(carboxyamino)imidazole ribonucleotide synthase [Chloroflexota bacterium]